VVQVLTPQDHAERLASVRFNSEQPFDVRPISHVEPPLWEGLQRGLAALRLIRSGRPDGLLVVGRQSVWLGAVLSTVTGVPMVAVGAGSEFTGRSRFGKLLTRWAYQRARHTVYISRYTRALMAAAGIDHAPAAGRGAMTLVPCGADARRFRPGLGTQALRERLGIGDRRVLLTVGQLSERKAQDVVIRALPAILEDHPDVVYAMVGLPTRRLALERLAAELGVGDHVLFAGAVGREELPRYYNLADLFVLVSRRAADGNVEGYGIVVAEAALCGVPAVVSRGCGLAEAVVDGQTGVLVESDDPRATAAAVRRILSDEGLRREMGQAARGRALATGTWAQRVAVYDDILRQIVGVP
jgi:phosphatidylinositol alpha-1,6-mannosyltransferase